jgi:hypothetical protein
VYGGLFYTLIGLPLHTGGALIWLLVVFVQANGAELKELRRTANLR